MNGEVMHLDWLGYVVLTIVMGSLFFIILAALLAGGKLRERRRATLLVVGMIPGLFVAVGVGVWLGGLVFSLLMG